MWIGDSLDRLNFKFEYTGNGGGSARMKFVLGIDSSSIVDFFSKNRQHLNSQLKVENRYKLTAGCKHKNLLNLGSFVIGARLMISQFFQTLISSGFVTHERSGWNTSYGWTWLWLKPWLEREDYKCDLDMAQNIIITTYVQNISIHYEYSGVLLTF